MAHPPRLAALLALSAVACSSPRIHIEHTRPPIFQLAPNQPVAVQAEADGTPVTGATVMDAAFSLTQGQVMNKWLAVDPVRQEMDAQLRGAAFMVVDRQSAALIIRAKPTAWSYEVSNGNGSGRLDVQIDVLDARNPSAPPLYSGSYWATSPSKHLGEPEAMLKAAQRLAGRFIMDLSPHRVSETVEFDDDDDAVKPALDLCRHGQFDAASMALTDVLARSPNSAPALYDLAVLTEARGAYDEAEGMLGRATQINPKPLYYQALERVRRSRADAQALQH